MFNQQAEVQCPLVLHGKALFQLICTDVEIQVRAPCNVPRQRLIDQHCRCVTDLPIYIALKKKKLVSPEFQG